MELDTTRRAVRWKYGYLTTAPQEEGARTRTPKRVRACPGALRNRPKCQVKRTQVPTRKSKRQLTHRFATSAL